MHNPTIPISIPVMLGLMLTKLGINDKRATGYKITTRVLNICKNYANYVNFSHKTQHSYFSQQAACITTTSATITIWVSAVEEFGDSRGNCS